MDIGSVMFWRYEIAGASMLLWNAQLHDGHYGSVSSLGPAGGLQGTDISPALQDFEPVLEAVRATEFPEKPSRRGALFLFEDEATCRRNARTWFPHARTHIIRCVLTQPAAFHRGHLGWMAGPSRERGDQCARSYWAGESAHEPHDWEVVYHGSVYFPDWEREPFGSLPTQRPV